MEFLEGGAVWEVASTSLHNDFLFPKNITRERPVALMPAMIRWWEAPRMPEVVKWQYKYGIECDATGSVGDGEVQMSRRTKRSGSSRPGLGPGEGLGTGQSPCGLGLGDALRFSEEDFAGAKRVLRAPEAGSVRRMCGGAAPDHYGHSARVEVELLAFPHGVKRRFE